MEHILLIDDDQFMRDIVATKLGEKGYKVTTADTGEMGFQKLDAEKPNLILLDLELPDTAGTEILQVLKSDDATKNIPIIIFTNNDNPEIRKKCSELGATDFFVKISIDVNELHEHIVKVLS